MATQLQWLGHGSWSIQSGNSKVLLDPFLDESPTSPVKSEDVEADYILVSHGHFDHVADVAPIAQRTGATVVSNFEITEWFRTQHGIEKLEPMNLGGGITLPFGRVESTIAHHSSQLPDGTYGGNPGGFLIRFAEGNVYFACDTALFADMQLIGRSEIEVAVVPIGDRFTMGPSASVEAVKLIRPQRVLPAHYGTWPPIEQDAAAWAEQIAAETSAQPIVLPPGGTVDL